MKRPRAMWWMVLILALMAVPAIAADEPAAAPWELPGFSCAATSSEPYVVFVDSLELDPLKNARPAANDCCALHGCCALIGSGCQNCPQGGRRWYDRYSCPNGQTCTLVPANCPTPC